MGTFTSLIFGTNGGMSVECQIFLKAVTEKLAKKTGECSREEGGTLPMSGYMGAAEGLKS